MSGNMCCCLVSDSGSESGSHKGGSRGKTGSGGGGSGDGKPTRVRTVLNEKQLHTLRTCYAANPRPDALMKEQLVEMTGLSPRVIRVWFQNKRCKDKKKTILMKQQMQQEKVGVSSAPRRAAPFRALHPSTTLHRHPRTISKPHKLPPHLRTSCREHSSILRVGGVRVLDLP